MNEQINKTPAQIHQRSPAPKEVDIPLWSLTDNKTWLKLVEHIENIKYSTQTVFKMSGTHLIKADHDIEPIFLYDNIILGMSSGKLAFLIDNDFRYVENRLLSEAMNQKRYNLAKLVLGTAIAGFIFDTLEKNYQKAFHVDDYCDLVHLTFDFKLYELNDAMSEWICKFMNGQTSLEDAPEDLKTTKFQFWESSLLSRNMLRHRNIKNCSYSVGCFLENVLLSNYTA